MNKRYFEKGQYSLDVCKIIINNHPEIKSIKIITHKAGINWRQKHLSDTEKLKNIKSSLIHSRPIKTKILTRNEFLKLELSELPKLKKDEVWSITSLVKCNDEIERHIPMMNFHPRRKNLSDIRKSIEILCPGYKGVILDSGRFFHYYGNALLTKDEWLRFMTDFLMPCILISPRYIGHRIYDGYCSLRLTTDKKHKTKIPKVVSIINL